MTGTRKFAIPRNGIGCHLGALDQGSVHVRFTDQRVDDQPDVVTIDRSQEFPITGPGIHLNLGEAGADALHSPKSNAVAAATAELTYGTLVCGDKSRKGRSLFRIFGR